MLKSKFSYYVILIFLISVSLSFLICFFIIERRQFFSVDTPLLFEFFFSLFFLYILLSLIFGELRSKVIVVFIGDLFISKRGFGGLGYKSVFEIKELDGYKISYISSKSGTYEFLYIIKNNKKVVKLSEFYHPNYKALKLEIIKKDIKNLGVVQWSLLQEIKEIFQ